MKQDNEIDQIFRDASNVNLNEEIPSVFLSDLNSRLDALEKKSKRPVAFWWLVGVFSLSIITWGATLLFNSTNNKTIAVKTENVEEIKSTKSKETTKSATNQTKSEIVNSDHYSTENKVENSLSYTSQVKNNRGAEKKKNGSNGLNKNDLAQIVLKTHSNLRSERTSSVQSSEKAAIESNKELSKSNAEIEMENVEPKIDKEIVQMIDSSMVLDSIQKNQTVEKIALAKEKKKLSITKEIGFFTGVSGIISSFAIPTVADSIVASIPGWRETREREEIATTSWDFSLRIKWLINNFTIQAGLDYFQWGEQIKYSYNSISGINRYSYLTIPINFGYTKTWDKFGVNPYGGVMLGYGIKRSGSYLQPDLNSIAQAESEKYLANYQLGCELFFISDSQFKFSLIPIYRASIKEVINTDIIRNRYKSIGLQIGISYKF